VTRIDAAGIGVSYVRGARRDDVQTAAYRALIGRRTRQTFWALDDVSFTAESGQVLGIVGGNGAGKTTLCRALSGLVKPDRGRLTVDGEVSALLSLGTGFDEQLSGRENIVLNGLMLGMTMKAVEALAPAIIEFSGIERFIDQPLRTYSAGMKARLGFSIGAMLQPDILILDETLSVGDLEFTARAGEQLEKLIQRARIGIIVSHQLELVTRYCTHALWLEKGRVRALGAPGDVVRAYRDSVESSQPQSVAVTSTVPSLPRVASAVTIVAKEVSVDYRQDAGAARRFRALDRVSFSVNEGEVLGLLGANGAGKTTLCKVLAGVIRPDGGEVRVAGDVTALLPVGTGLNHQLSGRDNVYLTGLLLGMPRRRIERVFDEIVAFAELEPFIDEPVKHYSRGMRAKLAFSTMTTVEPDTLIIDEALSVGDAAFAAKAAIRIRELIARARVVIVVTHKLAFIESVCTRALWLSGGTVAFDGAPEEAVRQYRARHRDVTVAAAR
jgi:teichoic acid transport system ATP-binding protein